MTSHLYSNQKFRPDFRPTFRSYSFKPASTTHRPADRADIERFEVRGKCTSSMASGPPAVFQGWPPPGALGADSSRSPGARSPGARSPGAKENEKLQHSSEMYAVAAELRERAKAMVLGSKDRKKEIKHLIVKNIVSKGKAGIEMMHKWDKNNDGEINKTEFRSGVRGPQPNGLGMIEIPATDVDSVFEELDSLTAHPGKQPGVLNLKYLDETFQKIKQMAIEEEKLLEEIKQTIDNLNERADAAESVAKLTEECETSSKALDDKCSKLPADVQLGAVMVRKGLKVVDILIKWDENGDGELDAEEFRHHARELGVIASDAAFDDVFNSFDRKREGSLDTQQLKGMLRSLQEMAKSSAADLEKQQKALEVSMKKVKKEQMILAVQNAKEMRQAAEMAARKAAEVLNLKVRTQRKASEEAKPVASLKAVPDGRRSASPKTVRGASPTAQISAAAAAASSEPLRPAADASPHIQPKEVQRKDREDPVPELAALEPDQPDADEEGTSENEYDEADAID